jgi:hypothetical protein
MRITAICIAVLVTAAAGASGQEGGGMRDPFFPSENRPKTTVTVPGGTEIGRDPFSNPLGGKATTSHSRPSSRRTGLTGIIFGKQSRVAIFNGEVLQEGGRVGDKRIVDIRRRSVLLKSASGAYEEVFLEDFAFGK